MPIPATAHSVGGAPKRRSELANALDAMAVYAGDGEDNEGTYWTPIMDGTNHVPAAIMWAQKRFPGRAYVWDYDDVGVRIWRTA